MRALVSSGRSDFVSSWPGHRRQARVRPPPRPTRRRRCRRRRGAVEAGRAHGDHLDRILRLHRRERVAGVDRPHERVGALDGGDVGDLRDVEHRRDARRDVLAEAGGRGEHVRVAAGLDDAAAPSRRRSRRSAPRDAARRRAAPWRRPAIAAAACAAGAAPLPATSTWTSPPELGGGGDACAASRT